MTQIIDISEPGLFETMSSYYQSVKHWEQQKNPIYERAAVKEKARYNYLKQQVLGNQAA